jgi:hypothetical protein
MKKQISIWILIFLSTLIWQNQLIGQEVNNNERTIYLMRAKQFYGSGAKMDITINGKSVYKLKNGNRLIIKLNSIDTLNIQIIYPPMKNYKSEVLTILPENENDIFIDLFYWGEGYNPFKHAGVVNPAGGRPEFNIEIARMKLDEGQLKFSNSDFYKDNNNIAEMNY